MIPKSLRDDRLKRVLAPRVFRLLILAVSLTALSCKSWEHARTPTTTELSTPRIQQPLQANQKPPVKPNYKRSIEPSYSQITNSLSTSTIEPRALETNLSGISITAVVFDSRTHRLAIADQPGGPGSRWPDAAAAGRDFGGIAAVNAGFFTPEGEPLGLVVIGGKRVSPVNNSSSLGAGLFIGEDSPSLQRRGHSTSAPEILQSGPFLVENGRAISALSQDSSTARTILGWDGGSSWFIARTGACSLAGLGQALAGAEIGGVKSRTVLNLDGGRSSDLWVEFSVQGGPISQRPFWNKPVRNFLILVPRK